MGTAVHSALIEELSALCGQCAVVPKRRTVRRLRMQDRFAWAWARSARRWGWSPPDAFVSDLYRRSMVPPNPSSDPRLATHSQRCMAMEKALLAHVGGAWLPLFWEDAAIFAELNEYRYLVETANARVAPTAPPPTRTSMPDKLDAQWTIVQRCFRRNAIQYPPAL